MTQCVDEKNSESSPDPFAGEFTCRFCVPLACQKLSSVPHAQEIQKLDYSNRVLLEVLNASTTNISNVAELAADTQQFLTTLGAKLDLLLRWTGQLITQNLSLPPAVDVDINAHGVKIFLDGANRELDLAERNLILIYLSEHYPEPLRLYARLVHRDKNQQGIVYALKVEHCSEETQDVLEKYIFKVHRQHISHLKKQSQRSDNT